VEQRDPFAIVPLWLVDLASPAALRLYAWIGAKYASGAAGTAWPSQTTLAADLGASERSVRRWLDELAELGAIRIQYRPGTSSVTTLIARSARDPGHQCPGYPGHQVPDPRTPVSAQGGHQCPPNQKTQFQTGAAAARGGGAVDEIRARDAKARADAADPETTRTAIAAAKARVHGGKPSTTLEVPE
jgi:DNA-binding transcriptional MocR family regulator